MISRLKRAFTLVELLVVMGVLAVLAAGLIAVINPGDRIAQANDSKAASDLNQMIGAMQALLANSAGGTYTAVAGATNTGSGFSSGFSSILTNELQVVPAGISGYVYGYSCTTASCKLAVQVKSNKYRGALATAHMCWLSTAGTVSTVTGLPASALSCP